MAGLGTEGGVRRGAAGLGGVAPLVGVSTNGRGDAAGGFFAGWRGASAMGVSACGTEGTAVGVSAGEVGASADGVSAAVPGDSREGDIEGTGVLAGVEEGGENTAGAGICDDEGIVAC